MARLKKNAKRNTVKLPTETVPTEPCDRCAGSNNPEHSCPLKLRIDQNGLIDTCNCCEGCTVECKNQVDAVLKSNPGALISNRI